MLLLDVNSAEELTLLVGMENDIKGKRFQSALAMGTSASGRLLWGGTWPWRLTMHAKDTALEQCIRTAGDVCKVIMANSEFQRKEFIEVAKQLCAASVAAVRQDYMQCIQNLAQKTVTLSNSSGVYLIYGYSSPR